MRYGMLLVPLAAVALAIWVYLIALRGTFWHIEPDPLVHNIDGPVASTPAVAPARNEAESVGCSVASLAAQVYPGEFRITLVDASSHDGTAELAARAVPGLDIL